MFSLGSGPRPDPLLPAPSGASTPCPSGWASVGLMKVVLTSPSCTLAGVMMGFPSWATTLS
eukprot:8071244-Heterocapsa_arctica.AAC.1